LVNPTNKLKVFRLVPETTSGLVANVDQSVVAVPAGSSKPVKVVASADKEGEYTFGVNIFSGETLTSKAVMSMGVEGASKTVANSVANPVVILAIVLSIVFVILLIILIVLITRRPEKAEETGESYY
jgi:preprotein translocase subunit SecG